MRKFSPQPRLRLLSMALACAGYAALTACSSADNELARFIEDTKKEAGRARRATAGDKALRDLRVLSCRAALTVPASSPGSGAGYGGIRPDAKRNREFLEQFSLDTLKMVGTLRLGAQMYGLVQTKDGLVHRVTAGNHLGQAEGKITDITPAKITLIEIVPDSLGGYMERPAALASTS